MRGWISLRRYFINCLSRIVYSFFCELVRDEYRPLKQARTVLAENTNLFTRRYSMKPRLVATLTIILVALIAVPTAITVAQDFQSGARAGGPAIADLMIQQFQTTGQPKFNNGKLEVPFRMVIRNLGTVPSNDNLVNGIRISNEYQWSGLMKSIAPQGTKVVNGVLKATPPAGARPNRDLHLIAMVDAPIAAADTSIPKWGRQRESNERNNTKALGVKIPPQVGNLTTGNSGAASGKIRPGKTTTRRPAAGGGPSPADLTVESFESQGQIRYRNGKLEIPFRMKIRNLGDLPTPANVLNGVSFGKQYRWSGLMKSVPAHGTRVATGVVKIPDPGQLQKGRRVKLVAMADAPIAAADTSIPKSGRVQENNETNNYRTLEVKVPGGLKLTDVPGNQDSPTQKPTRKKRFGKR